MKLPRRKRVDWSLKYYEYQMEKRVKRWFKRMSYKLLVRSFISEVKNDVIGAVSAGAIYLDEVDIRYKVIAYKFLSMRYGLEFWVDWKDRSDCEVSYGFSIAIKKSK